MYYFGICQQDVDNGEMYEAPYQVINGTFHVRMDTNSSYMLGETS